MRHKWLVFFVSLGFGVFVFLLLYVFHLWLGFSMAIPIIAGVAVLAVGVGLSGHTYYRSSKTLNALLLRLKRETILYGDIASLMDKGNDRTGALVITKKRLVFETPKDFRGRSWNLDFCFPEIALAENRKDYFHLAAGGRDNRFKVFNCDALVDIIHEQADIELQAAIERKKAADAAKAEAEAAKARADAARARAEKEKRRAAARNPGRAAPQKPKTAPRETPKVPAQTDDRQAATPAAPVPAATRQHSRPATPLQRSVQTRQEPRISATASTKSKSQPPT